MRDEVLVLYSKVRPKNISSKDNRFKDKAINFLTYKTVPNASLDLFRNLEKGSPVCRI